MNSYPRYWIAFTTILVKEILRFSRIWVQTVLPSTITTALYFVIFGQLIGERIGPMDGFDYEAVGGAQGILARYIETALREHPGDEDRLRS